MASGTGDASAEMADTRDDVALRATVARLRDGWHVDDVRELAFLPGGYSNLNYRFEHRGARYVLRLPTRERPYVDRALEHALYAAPREVLMPEIEAFDASTGAMISHWQAGPLLADAPPEPAALVPYLRALHRDLPAPGRAYDPAALSRGQLAAGNAPQWIRDLAAALVWSPPETTACHNDLNPWNIIRTPEGRLMTLDWEWFGANDPVFDLVTLHQGLGFDDDALPELAGDLLAERAEPVRLRFCLTAFWLREYAWAHAECAHGNDRAEVKEQVRLAAAKLEELYA